MEMEDQKTISRKEETLWIWDNNQMQMMRKKITFVPFLYQLFDNILVSAAHRKGVKDILVNINVADNRISVWTHGGCLDDINSSSIILEAHQYGVVRVTSGDCTDVPEEEVVNIIGPDLEEVHISEDWCFVLFIPHLAHFGMECLEHDVAALMKRRVVDLAGASSGLNVQLAGTHSLPRNFRDYVELYIQTFGGTPTYPTRIYEKLNDGWEICVATADLEFIDCAEVSFVNNIPKMEVGQHITGEITDYLARIIDLQPDHIEFCLWVFVNVNNPHSQTKGRKLTPSIMKKIVDSLKDLEALYEYWRVESLDDYLRGPLDDYLRESLDHYWRD